MQRFSKGIAVGTLAGLASLFAVAPAGVATAAARGSATTAIAGSQSEAASSTNDLGAVPASTVISFEVTLNPQHAAGAAALVEQVSDPTSASYRHYLTPARWESRFSPSTAQLQRVTAWLHGAGLTPGAVTPDHLAIAVSGTAAQVDHAFGTTLHTYKVQGREVRLTSSAISVPAEVAPLVQGAPGLDQDVATPTDAAPGRSDQASSSGSNAAAPSSTPIPPPPGYRSPPPCSSYFGQTIDATDPSYGTGFATHLPYPVCGYTPQQIESGYALTTGFAGGIDGKGQTVAVVDAYEASTLQSDVQQFYRAIDPADPLPSSQFSTDVAPNFTEKALCQASGWSGEQTLDVIAVHATAPGAHILYVGGGNCFNGLLDADRQVVDGHLADVMSNSWGDDAGDLLDTSSDKAAYDTVYEMAAATGVSVLFSAGDDGDEFTTTGLTAPDYPPSSPFVTSVGGTSLEIGSNGTRTEETGWSNSQSTLCNASAVGTVTGCTKKTLGTYLPADPGAYLFGGGGGTSYFYQQPFYQKGVVPKDLAERNTVNGNVPYRVEPDISMDGDPFTGILVGETQNFGGVDKFGYYDIGGTSVSSPLFAGVMADANQAAGADFGFANPALYKLYSSDPDALYDTQALKGQAVAFSLYNNSLNNSAGQTRYVATLGYEGIETYCDATKNCESRDVAITSAPGFDSMTGVGTPGMGFVLALAKE
jgi:subtilase family serine protease